MSRKCLLSVVLCTFLFAELAFGGGHWVDLSRPERCREELSCVLRSGQFEWFVVRHPGECILSCLAIRYPDPMPFGGGAIGMSNACTEHTWGRIFADDPWLQALSPMAAVEVECGDREGTAFFWFGPLPMWEYRHPLVLHFDIERKEVSD